MEEMDSKSTKEGDVHYDIIVVGAGLSGLMCADTVLAHVPAARVLVLEVNDRCGGRTKSVPCVSRPEVIVDEGGMWIGNQHETMLSLCKRFNVELIDQFCDGYDVTLTSDGQRYVGEFLDLSTAPSEETDETQKHATTDMFPSQIDAFAKSVGMDTAGIPAGDGFGGSQIGTDLLLMGGGPTLMTPKQEIDTQVKPTLLELIEEVPAEEPWTYLHAREMDSYSVESYFRAVAASKHALEFLNDLCRALLGCESSQVSLLFLLWSLKTSGGLEFVISSKDGAQEYRMLGGAQQISDGLRKSVESHKNAKILFEQRVERLDRDSKTGKVSVRTQNSAGIFERFTCNRVVCTANASVFVREASFVPRLPTAIEQFAQRTFRGSYGKALVVFKSPFWREQEISGTMTNSGRDAFVCSSMDYSIDPMAFYALACFFSGNPGLQAAAASSEERRIGVLNDISKLAGVPLEEVQTQFIEYHEYLWHSDRIAQGCSGVIFGPGQFESMAPGRVFGTTSHPKATWGGSLFFAGTDVCTVFGGYMEGAVASGKQVGIRIAEDLLNLRDSKL